MARMNAFLGGFFRFANRIMSYRAVCTRHPGVAPRSSEDASRSSAASTCILLGDVGGPPSSTWASEQEPKGWFACLRYLLCRVKMLFTRWGRSDGQSLLSLRVRHALTNIGRMLSRLVRCDQHHGASWNPFWRRARNGHSFEEQLPRRPSPLRSGQRRMRTPPLGDSAASPWNATRRIRCFPGVNSFFSSGAIPPRCPRSRTAQF